MGIFIKRPLCLFCFCFIGTSLLSLFLPCAFFAFAAPITLSLALSILFFVISARPTKRKYGLTQAAISFLCTFFALIVSFFTIYIPCSQQKNTIGEERAVEFLIVEEDYSTTFSTQYSGKLLSVDKQDVKLPANLLLDHEADFVCGDVLYLVGNIICAEKSNNYSGIIPNSRYVYIEQAIDKDLIICDEYDKFSPSVMSAKLRNSVRSYFIDKLDFSSASLSIALFTGDTDMLERNTIRDFRRSGLSHILAVSGLHLAIIIVTFNYLLKKLCVAKAIRCVLFSFIAILILFLSGFSPSACRSVIMLLCPYLLFTLSRDPDALTSLSIAGALILLFSPSSVYSVSFWLSFLSTFGLVSWAALLSSIADRIKTRSSSKASKRLPGIIKKIFAVFAVTAVANASICIVICFVFGEISLISLLTNLIITPICSFYLILTISAFLLGAIPFASEALSAIMGATEALITSLASFFSKLDISVISLEYTFAKIIIVSATIIFTVLLIIKLKRKRLMLLVPACASVLLFVCLAVQNLLPSANVTKVIYTSTERGDIITLTNRSSATIVDASNGSYSTLTSAYYEAKELCVTDIETVILTDCYIKHISTLDSFLRTAMVKDLYLPEPTDEEDLLIVTDIVRSARSLGVNTTIYSKETLIELGGKADLLFTAAGDRSDLTVSVSNEKGSLIYTDTLSSNSVNAELKKLLCEKSDVLILGDRKSLLPTEINLPDRIIIPSAATLPALAGQSDSTEILIAREKDERIRSCIFKLEG